MTMSNNTIGRLVSIAENIISGRLQISMKGLVKSQTVFRKVCNLFEYAAEIVILAKNNNRFAKTNAILLRVLLEVLLKILLIKKHILEYKTMQKQEEIVRAFELRSLEENIRHWKRREESLQEMKNPPGVTEKDIADIQKTEEKIREQKGVAERRIQEHKEQICDNSLMKLVAYDNVYKQSVSVFDAKKARYVFSGLYQNCSQYIHPNHILSEEEERSKDLSEIEGIFACTILEFDIICHNEILNGEDRNYLREITSRPEDKEKIYERN